MIGIPLLRAGISVSGTEAAAVHVVQVASGGHNHDVLLRPSSDLNLETGGSAWHASLALARYLTLHPELVRGKTVVELGSGCGLLSVVAAQLGAHAVIATDLHVQQPVLQYNIDLNFGESSTKVIPMPLPFGDLAAVEHIRKILVAYPTKTDLLILASDIGYDVALHVPISQTIEALLASADGILGVPRIIIAEEIRWRDIFGWFRDELEAKWGMSNGYETSSFRESELPRTVTTSGDCPTAIMDVDTGVSHSPIAMIDIQFNQ